jgi:hypothetical protein
MHRSGTSALGRVISLLGADLPHSLLPPSATNETGYWESSNLMVLHDEILTSAGSNWHDWRAFNADWYTSPVAPIFKRRILDVLRKDFADSQLFIIKDPRICRFWPLWREILEEFGAKPGVVIPVRNPLEVMASLRRRNGFVPAKSCLLWLRHVVDAERATRGLPRAVVTYDALLADWQSVVATLESGLGMSWPRRGARAELEIERFLATQLRHHTIASQQLAAKAEVVDWVKEAYAALLQLAVTPEHRASMARLDRIGAEFEKASTAFGVVLVEGEEELAKREAENAHLRAESGTLRQRVSDLSDERRRLSDDAEIAANRLREELEGAHATLSAERQRAAEQANRLAGLERDRSLAEASRAAAAEEARQQGKEELESAHATLSAERQRTAEQADRLADLERDRSLAEAGCAAAAEEARQLRAELAVQARIAAEQSGMIGSLRLAQSHTERQNADLGCRIHELEQALSGEKEAMSVALARIADLKSAVTDAGSRPAIKYTVRRFTSLTRLIAAGLEKCLNRKLVAGSGLFDRDWYLKNNPDVRKSGLDPVLHYLKFGAAEGRKPNPLFDSDWYLQQYPDVRATNINPLVHYLRHGAAEGCDPSPLFDSDWYLDQNLDVRASRVNPLTHYLQHGMAEGRRPSASLEGNVHVSTVKVRGRVSRPP